MDVAERMRGLRADERRALHLSVFQGLPHETIAERTGVAVGTVKSRLSRARRALAA
jgi:DNA-directed RNA polymerase specialized sigma subunit, sigma24 homolog